MLFVQGAELKVERFPNGEVRIPLEQEGLRGINEALEVRVRLHYEADCDLTHLVMLRGHLEQVSYKKDIHLFIDYLPYSRMDRQTSDLFTLKFVCQMINSMKFDSVMVNEAHSDVSCALLDRCTNVSPTSGWLLERAMEEFGFNRESDYLFFPDAGAQKRYGELGDKYLNLVGSKHRDERGNLSGHQIMNAERLASGAGVLIVDDLCSRGGTFVGAAKGLKALGLNLRVGLVVTHLEEAVYEGELLNSGLIEMLVATNSMQQIPKHPIVRLYDIVSHERIER